MTEAKNLIEEHESLKGEVGSLNELLEEANVKITEVVKVNEELTAKLATQDTELAKYESELLESESENTELKEKVETLTHEDNAVEKKVSEVLNEVGVEPVSLDSNIEEVNYADEWSKITDPSEKTKFYRENKTKIRGNN